MSSPQTVSFQISHLSQCLSRRFHFSPMRLTSANGCALTPMGQKGQLRASNPLTAGESAGLKQPLYPAADGKTLAMTNTFPNLWSLANICVCTSSFACASGRLAWEANRRDGTGDQLLSGILADSCESGYRYLGERARRNTGSSLFFF